LPYYIKTENNTGKLTQNSPWHGYSGPVQVSDPAYRSVEANAFVESSNKSGIPFLADFNGDPTSRIGGGFHQYNIRNGIRDSSANAYLAPTLSRSNLHIMVHTQVIKLSFAGTKVNSIQYILNQNLSTVSSVNVSKEVVLTAGTINTPKLLLLSGIGNEADLSKFPDIPRVANVPGVGMHFQDHPIIFFSWEVVNKVEPSISTLSYWQGEYDQHKTGFLAAIDSAGLFLNSGLNRNVPRNIPDVQVGVTDQDGTYIVYVNVPESRNGTVKLHSSNPLDSPLIVDPVWPENIQQSDINTIKWSIDTIQKILSIPPMSTIVGQRTIPPSTYTQQQLLDYVRNNVQSGNHMVGTCSMGMSAAANDVVDAQLRVFGVTGVRVADASIIPVITNGNPEATIMAIAERAADLIKHGQ